MRFEAKLNTALLAKEKELEELKERLDDIEPEQLQSLLARPEQQEPSLLAGE